MLCDWPCMLYTHACNQTIQPAVFKLSLFFSHFLTLTFCFACLPFSLPLSLAITDIQILYASRLSYTHVVLQILFIFIHLFRLDGMLLLHFFVNQIYGIHSHNTSLSLYQYIRNHQILTKFTTVFAVELINDYHSVLICIPSIF